MWTILTPSSALTGNIRPTAKFAQLQFEAWPAGAPLAAASSGAAGVMSPFLSTRLWRLREASTSSSQVRRTVTQGKHWCIRVPIE